MLNKSKLVVQLYKVEEQLFPSTDDAFKEIYTLWQNLILDESFLQKVHQLINLPWCIPSWDDQLRNTVPIKDQDNPYSVIAVDGSQVYPDSHHISSCCLINIGHVLLRYGRGESCVDLFSEPYIFVNFDDNALPFTVDVVNGKRQELELLAGLNFFLSHQQSYRDKGLRAVVLFDGSLIFWHLLSQDIHIKRIFLDLYFNLLECFFYHKIITAWYISLPKSRELINIINTYVWSANGYRSTAESFDKVIDTHLMRNFLSHGMRTIVFRNNNDLSVMYPEYMRPFFFYINNGYEIGRIEIPAWIACDDALVDYVATIVLDQCKKGYGYPVSLAESHEQAVVKGPDRDFFYHLLQKMIIEKRKTITISQKSMKKRGIGV